MNRFAARVIPVVLLLLLASCGESGLLLPALLEDGDIAVQTVADGAVLLPDENVEISMTVGPQGSDPDRVIVSLVDPAGRVARSVSHAAADLDRGRVPPLPVAGLEPGLYLVEIEFSAAGRHLGGHERTIFIVNGAHRVAGITIYPPFFQPDSLGILRADLDLPADADPYLRWSFAGRPISEGRLSAGAGEIVLRSPRAEGVYAVRLELFPYPPRGASFRFPSPIVQNSDLVVRESRPGGERGLGPTSSFYALFHLAGNLRDSGMRAAVLRTAPAQARLIGEADPRIVQEFFGYHFEDGTGIEVDEVLLPFRGDALDPFSVVMRLVPGRLATGSVLFSAESSAGRFALVIRHLDEGYLEAELRNGELSARVATDSAVMTPGVPLDLNLAVLPDSARTEFRWFAQGERVGGGTVAIGFPRPSPDAVHRIESGRTRIGGPGGFTGLLGGFGVFFRDGEQRPAADIERFRAAGTRRFGEDLILAEGFEAGLGNVRESQDAAVIGEAGVLRIAPGGTITITPLHLTSDAVVVEVTLVAAGAEEPSTPGDVTLDLVSAAEDGPIASISLDGVVSVAGSAPYRLSFSNPARLVLALRDGEFVLSGNVGDSITIPADGRDGEVELTVGNRSTDRTVEIGSILVYRDRERTTGVSETP